MQRIKYEWRNLCVFVSALSSFFFSIIHYTFTGEERCFVQFAYIKNISGIAYGERRNPLRNMMEKNDIEECSA